MRNEKLLKWYDITIENTETGEKVKHLDLHEAAQYLGITMNNIRGTVEHGSYKKHILINGKYNPDYKNK